MSEETTPSRRIEISFREPAQDTEKWRESIPAFVFLNHYFSINFHISTDESRYDLHQVPYFRELQLLRDVDLEGVRHILLNCWSAEYSMRLTGEHESEDFIRFSLHWTFPQAFYSFMLGAQAFYHAMGMEAFSSMFVEREFARHVMRQDYPSCIGFYADGTFNDTRIHGLPMYYPRNTLTPVLTEEEAQSQIGTFLKTTRRIKAWELREKIQGHPSTSIKSAAGQPVNKFTERHWKIVTDRLGPTTLFDLMSRLHISANHHEIQRFMRAEIDFFRFHYALRRIVSYTNFVHEAYIAKVIGIPAYLEILNSLPPYLRGKFVEQRFEKGILPLLN